MTRTAQLCIESALHLNLSLRLEVSMVSPFASLPSVVALVAYSFLCSSLMLSVWLATEDSVVRAQTLALTTLVTEADKGLSP